MQSAALKANDGFWDDFAERVDGLDLRSALREWSTVVLDLETAIQKGAILIARVQVLGGDIAPLGPLAAMCAKVASGGLLPDLAANVAGRVSAVRAAMSLSITAQRGLMANGGLVAVWTKGGEVTKPFANLSAPEVTRVVDPIQGRIRLVQEQKPEPEILKDVNAVGVSLRLAKPVAKRLEREAKKTNMTLAAYVEAALLAKWG